jgi:4'-phosphopantetheinyl transferase
VRLQQEYDVIYRLQQVAFPNDKQEYKMSNADSFREHSFSSGLLNCFHTVVAGSLMTQLLPLLMMRHRRVPRAKWIDHITPNGKHWIEHVCLFSSLLYQPSGCSNLKTMLGARNE